MKLRVIIAILSVVCLTVSCSNAQEPPVVKEPANETAQQTKFAELTEEQAIVFAEKFIAQNGYTDLAPDKGNLVHESIEWESNIDELLKMRHNTLERKAFGILRGRKGGPGLTVVFKYKNPLYREMKKNGRAVTMNPDRSNGRVEHQDFILAKVGKKL